MVDHKEVEWPFHFNQLAQLPADARCVLAFRRDRAVILRQLANSGWLSSIHPRFRPGSYEYNLQADLVIERTNPDFHSREERLNQGLANWGTILLPSSLLRLMSLL